MCGRSDKSAKAMVGRTEASNVVAGTGTARVRARYRERKKWMKNRNELTGVAPGIDVPIRYIERIRDYYQGLGYGAPYRWAHHVEVPFHPLPKSLAGSRVALVTTAAPFLPGGGDQGPGAPYNAHAKFYRVYSGDTAQDHDLRISHLAYDRAHTTAEDANTWFPLPQLRRSGAAGRIGAVAPRFHGVPTNRSQRVTITEDCPELVARCREDAVDAALLVAN
jgi:hypothetical protein